MEFKKYHKITNSYSQKFVDRVEIEFPDMTYIVQEKIHGANFSIWFKKDCNIRYASRNRFLTDESFHCYKLSSSVEQAANHKKLTDLSNELNCEQIVITGELFGGSYNHPDVPRIPNGSKVQKGVDYCPDVQFFAFDLEIDGEMISPVEAAQIFQRHGIPHVPILFEGNLEGCLNYPNDFDSKIPSMLGLPPIEGNTCEGTVVKPVIPSKISNGSTVMFKNKNEKFAEKQKVRKKITTPDEPLSELGTKFAEELMSMVTENRLDNVVSKIAEEIEMKHFGQLIKLLAFDCLEEFIYPIWELEKSEEKRLKKMLNQRVVTMVKKNIQKYL